jgi:hypothetical protein
MGVNGGTESIHKIAMLGNHLPRQCGIATFTTDLSAAIAEARPEHDCFVVAIMTSDGTTPTPIASSSRSPNRS